MRKKDIFEENKELQSSLFLAQSYQDEGSLTHTYKANKLELVMELYHYMGIKIRELKLPVEAQYRLNTNFIGHIRTCIKLEVFYADKNGFGTAIQNIRKICSRKDVQTLIGNYPKSSFNRSQYIYNFAMEHVSRFGLMIIPARR